MGQYGQSTQNCTITLVGTQGTAGPFGGKVIKIRRTYNNADTSTTYSTEQDPPGIGWEESVPITRGMYIDVEVPFKADVNISEIENFFDNDTFETDPPTPLEVTVELDHNGGNNTYEADVILESYEINNDAKDARRLMFTCRVTGGTEVGTN